MLPSWNKDIIIIIIIIIIIMFQGITIISIGFVFCHLCMYIIAASVYDLLVFIFNKHNNTATTANVQDCQSESQIIFQAY